MTQPVFRFAPSPERPPASRSRALGAAQCRDGARGGRALAAAHRGHRRDALPARIRGGDPGGPRLARHRVGTAGAAPVGAFRRLPRRACEAAKRRASSIRASRAAPRSRASSPSARRRRRGRAIRTARRSIPATPRRLSADEQRGADGASEPYALRLDMNAAVERTGALTWVETGENPEGRSRHADGAAGSVGRRRARPQGDADQLSSFGRGRRRAAGRDARGARAGSAAGDQRASRAAGAARLAGAALPSSPADPRCRGAQAVEVDAGDRAARTARRRRHARRRSAAMVRASTSGASIVR